MFKKILYSNNSLENINKIDYPLLWTVLILLAFGLVIVYSATASTSKIIGHSDYYFLVKQFAFMLGIIIFCVLLSLLPIKFWFKYYKEIIIISIILLVIVLFIGGKVGLTHRWINIFWFNIQPSELFKLAMIIYLSGFITNQYYLLHDFKNFKQIFWLPFLGMILVCLGGDLGSCVILFLVFIFMLFIGGVKKIWIVLIITVAIGLLLLAIYMEPYRFRRVQDFIHLINNPHKNTIANNFQVKTAFKAISTGGITGVGLGNSIIARFFLPEVHTDFVFALIIEELGLITGLILIIIFLWIGVRGFIIAKKSYELEEYFSFFLARGICFLIILQAGVNIAVNIGLLPSTGLTLPFISYGGSSLLINLVAITFLLKIDYENKRKMRGFKI